LKSKDEGGKGEIEPGLRPKAFHCVLPSSMRFMPRGVVPVINETVGKFWSARFRAAPV
jgi:hypothetical protein